MEETKAGDIHATSPAWIEVLGPCTDPGERFSSKQGPPATSKEKHNLLIPQGLSTSCSVSINCSAVPGLKKVFVDLQASRCFY